MDALRQHVDVEPIQSLAREHFGGRRIDALGGDFAAIAPDQPIVTRQRPHALQCEKAKRLYLSVRQ
jgi:hypothetical protein